MASFHHQQLLCCGVVTAVTIALSSNTLARSDNSVAETLPADIPATATAFLTVQIEPAGALALGAAWSIDGEQWHSSGSELELSCEQYCVRFRHVPGCIAPSDWVINLDYPSRYSTLNAVYELRAPSSYPFYLPLRITSQNGDCYTLHAVSDRDASDNIVPEEDRLLAPPAKEDLPAAALLALRPGANTPAALSWDCHRHAEAMQWLLQVNIPLQSQSLSISWALAEIIGDNAVRLVDMANPLHSYDLHEAGEVPVSSPGSHQFLVTAHGPAMAYTDLSVLPGWNLVNFSAPPAKPWQTLLRQCAAMTWSDRAKAWVRSRDLRAGPHWLFALASGTLRVYLESDTNAAAALATGPWVLTTLDTAGLWLGAPQAVWSWQGGNYRPVTGNREANRPYWVFFTTPQQP